MTSSTFLWDGLISAELVTKQLNSDQFAFWLPTCPKSQLGINLGSNWSIFGHLRLELVKISSYSDQFALPRGRPSEAELVNFNYFWTSSPLPAERSNWSYI
jgi:hypothetical protein